MTRRYWIGKTSYHHQIIYQAEVQYSMSSSHGMPHVKQPSYMKAQVRLLFSLFTIVCHSCCRARTSFEKQSQGVRYPTGSCAPSARRVLSTFLITNFHSPRRPLRRFNYRTLFRLDVHTRGSLSRWNVKKVIYVTRKDSDEGEGRRGRRVRRPLLTLCEGINSALLEMCVMNKGRPLAAAITDFVERTIEAFMSGGSTPAKALSVFVHEQTRLRTSKPPLNAQLCLGSVPSLL